MTNDNQEFDDEIDLRGFSPEGIEADNEKIGVSDLSEESIGEESVGSVQFKVDPFGEPQASGTKYYVIDQADGQKYYAGKVLKYGSRRGLSRASTLLKYDRFESENDIGLWAHFMWPSVMAESHGRYITINAWDRAHFTWGFYQLAAHTARDNLILLARELLKLPSAGKYFPDLTLDSEGKVAKIKDGDLVSLEREVQVDVGNWTETQIPDFMEYLNPSSRRVDNSEVLTSAKFAAWALEDPAMRKATVEISVAIMKRKIKARANTFGLIGKRPELAIWISDMFHQGRGSVSQVRDALSLSTFEKQLDALSEIDTTGNHAARRKTVRKHIKVLMDEERFKGIGFGEGALSFDEPIVGS